MAPAGPPAEGVLGALLAVDVEWLVEEVALLEEVLELLEATAGLATSSFVAACGVPVPYRRLMLATTSDLVPRSLYV